MSSPQPNPPAKGRTVKLALGALVLLGLGAGGAYGAVATGMIGADGTAAAPDEPRLVRKGEDDPYAPPTDSKEGDDPVEGEGGSEYRTSYYKFEDSFTSNLSGSPSLIQVTLAASTRRDGRVLQWLGKHQLALRSAILVELAETSAEEANSVSGKAALQKRLTLAINRVLTETEGFGGVDQVHFQGYLVQ